MKRATGQGPSSLNLDQRMRTVQTIWIALIASVSLYYLFTLIVQRPRNLQPNETLSLALLGAAVTSILLSFLLKSRLVKRAVEMRQVNAVQQGYITTWAIAEVPALLGMLDFFATGDPHYYVLMIMAAVTQLLHFPRREHFADASFKSLIEDQITGPPFRDQNTGGKA